MIKYKLLSEKGRHFVCLENGIKIPYQIETKVIQYCMEKALVTASAYIDERLGRQDDIRLVFDFSSKRLSLKGDVLDGIKDMSLFTRGEAQMACVEFTVECEIVDTVEKPININTW